MKLFLRNFLIYLFVGFFTYVIGLNLVYEILPPIYRPNILYQAKNGLLEQKIKESKNPGEVDVLFIGSSHAYNSFDPRIFEKYGIKSLNWGTSQQTHVQTKMVLREYLEVLNPKLVVYEVFPEMFAMEGRESMTDFLNTGKPFQLGLKEIFTYDNSIIFINTYLIKYTRKIFGFIEEQQNSEDIQGYYKGYVPNEGENSYYQDSGSIKWVPRGKQLEAFQENLNLLKSRKTDYLLVISPFPFNYNNEEEYTNYLNSMGELLDYNKILEFDKKEDFSDFHHINLSGVKKMNGHLAPLIKEKLEEIQKH